MKNQLYILALLLLSVGCKKKPEIYPDPIEREPVYADAATAVSGTYYSTRASYYWTEPRPVAVIKDSLVISRLSADSVQLKAYINTVNDNIDFYKIMKVKKKDGKTYELFHPTYNPEYAIMTSKEGEIIVTLGDATVYLYFNKKK